MCLASACSRLLTALVTMLTSCISTYNLLSRWAARPRDSCKLTTGCVTHISICGMYMIAARLFFFMPGLHISRAQGLRGSLKLDGALTTSCSCEGKLRLCRGQRQLLVLALHQKYGAFCRRLKAEGAAAVGVLARALPDAHVS